MQNRPIMTTCLVKINPIQSRVSVLDIRDFFLVYFIKYKHNTMLQQMKKKYRKNIGVTTNS